MDPIQKRKLISFYIQQIAQHGFTPMGVGWANQAYNQQIRFKVLTTIGPLQNKSILDVGCGYAAFYQYLKEHNVNVLYTGIDIVQDYITKVQKLYPEIKLISNDFMTHKFHNKFDYVFCSGGLSFFIHNYKIHYFRMIKKMFYLSKYGIGFNMLDSSEHPSDNTYATYNPSEVIKFCSKLTKNYKIDHTYLKHDFTVFMYHK